MADLIRRLLDFTDGELAILCGFAIAAPFLAFYGAEALFHFAALGSLF